MMDARRWWCLGLPETYERELTSEEWMRVRRFIDAVRGPARLYAAFALLALIGSLFFVALLTVLLPLDFAVADAPTVAFSLLALFLFGLGLFGALGEVLFGFSAKGRYGFALAVLLCVGGLGLSPLSPFASVAGPFSELFFLAGMVCGVAGAVAIALRIMDHARALQMVRRVEAALDDGGVFGFEGEVAVPDGLSLREVGGEATVERDEPGFRRELHHAETLGDSGLVLHLDGQDMSHLTLAEVRSHADTGSSAMEVPLSGFEVVGDREGWHFLQRHLAPLEATELERSADRVLRHGCFFSLGGFALLTTAGRALDRALRPVAQGVVRWEPIAIAFVLVALYGAVFVRRWWLMRRDARLGTVVVVRPTETMEERRLPEERLPHSTLIWTMDGEPAPWRRGLGSEPSGAD